uniref:DNA repair protein REV1 n=2 Tax=Clytia hemisphaerica TaxID=252671 RepID=A0A7M5WQM1_9CNID
MGEHGGKYQHSFSKTYVTHVIATNLPDSKIKNLKRNDKVVRPNWIVDSLKAGRLLSIDKYLLYSVNKRDGNVLSFQSLKTKQPSLDSGFGSESLPAPSKHANDITTDNADIIDQDSNKTCHQQPILSKHDYSTKPKSTIKSPLKAGQDNFISEYYTHSRLHHLSMWKAELKKFTDSIQKKRVSSTKTVPSHFSRQTLIMHVDLDSFFVSVSLKLNSELRGKPVAVCHSTSQGPNTGSSSSFSEIASCNYEARQYGCRNGMMLNRAKSLCPNLICVPYQFEEYRDVSQKFYEVLASHTTFIEAVSCDEALMDISKLISGEDDNEVKELAEKIRSEVLESTGCTASCGIGNSVLIARLATRRAKPDGVHYVLDNDIPEFIACQKVIDLPGIGRAQGEKFTALNIQTCKELQMLSLTQLQKEFGPKQGDTLYKFCRGKDDRGLKLEHERKSVSAEINYGMRFKEYEEVDRFMKELSQEVSKRLKEVSKKGSQITLKVMIRKKDAMDPAKYMGHGICDHFSKGVSLPEPTSDPLVISKNCVSILKTQKIPASDLRGIGIQMTKLCDSSSASTSNTLMKFAQKVTAEQLHQRDRIVKASEKVPSQPPKTVKEKRLPSINTFIRRHDDDGSGNHQQQNLFQQLSPKKNPPLPNISVDQHASPPQPDIGNQPETKGADSTSFQDISMSQWDPDVLSELPEHIQQELKQQMKIHKTLTTSSVPSKINTSPSTSKTSKANTNSPSAKSRSNAKIYANQNHKNIFKKGRGRPKKIDKIFTDSNKYGTILDTMSATRLVKSTKGPQEVVEEIQTNTASQRPGFLSPERVDMDVLNELPEEIRNQIWNDLKKTSVNFKKPKSNHQPVASSLSTLPGRCSTTSTSTTIGNTKNVNQLPSSSTSKHGHSPAKQNSIQKDTFSSSSLNKDVSNHLSVEQASGLVKASSTGSSAASPIRINTGSATLIQRQVIPDIVSPSQLDASFLRALPEKMRAEILEESRNVKKKRPSDDIISIGKRTKTVASCDERLPDLEIAESADSNDKQKTCVEDMMLLSPSAMDQSVLEALPNTIRNEILNESKQRKISRDQFTIQSKQQTAKLISTDNRIAKENIFPINDDLERRAEKLIQVLPAFHGAKTYEEVKSLLREWTTECDDVPDTEDVEEVERYFHELLNSYNMETLFLLLKFTKRLFTSKPLKWHEAFNELHSKTQETIKLMYNGKLPVDPFNLD